MITEAEMVAGFVLTLAGLAAAAYPLWKMSVTANQLQENVLPWFTPPGPDGHHDTLPVQVAQIREAATAAADEARKAAQVASEEAQKVRTELRNHMDMEEELSRVDLVARSLEQGHNQGFRQEVIARLDRLETQKGQ